MGLICTLVTRDSAPISSSPASLTVSVTTRPKSRRVSLVPLLRHLDFLLETPDSTTLLTSGSVLFPSQPGSAFYGPEANREEPDFREGETSETELTGIVTILEENEGQTSG